jgi:hypothetical protein
VAGLKRNGWPHWPGMGGRFGPEYATNDAITLEEVERIKI